MPVAFAFSLFPFPLIFRCSAPSRKFTSSNFSSQALGVAERAQDVVLGAASSGEAGENAANRHFLQHFSGPPCSRKTSSAGEILLDGPADDLV